MKKIFLSFRVILWCLPWAWLRAEPPEDHIPYNQCVQALTAKKYEPAFKCLHSFAVADSTPTALSLDAKQRIAWMYYKGQGVAKNDQQAFTFVQEPAAQGIAEAQKLLGTLYLNGHGTSADPEKAYFWFKKAADQKDGMAERQVCWMLKKGIGVTANPSEGKKWCARAVEQCQRAAPLLYCGEGE